MSYYSSDDKITYDEAAEYVEQYIRMKQTTRARVTSKDVANAFDIRPTHHNLIRLNNGLDSSLSIAEKCRCRASKYRLP